MQRFVSTRYPRPVELAYGGSGGGPASPANSNISKLVSLLRSARRPGVSAACA